MQFTMVTLALSLSSTALGVAVDASEIVPGVKIRAPGAPVAKSLNIVQSLADVQKRDVEKRATGHLFVCTDSNFKGACQNLEFTTGNCLNLGGSFKDSISSAGPDQGFTCSVCTRINCSGTCINSLVSPGIFDFNNFSPNVNDRIESYVCRQT